MMHNLPVPTVIDDDVQRTAEGILRTQSETGGVLDHLDPEGRRRVLESVCVALQAERNGWKERLQSTLQEIDRQHRASIALDSSLQDLVLNLGIKTVDSPNTNGRRSSDVIRSLQTFIHQLQDKVDRAADNTELQKTVVSLRETMKKLEQEKGEQAEEVKEKSREVSWLHKELNTVKSQLQKMRQIVLNYNQSHSTNFHLEEESVEGPRSRSDPLLSRERTYVEGDQVNYFSTSGEEIAVWKLRNRKFGEFGGGGGGGGGGGSGSTSHRGTAGSGRAVTQCLRCNTFFKGPDNNSRACRYHKKGRQIREQYDPSGRLLRVLYTWACCKKGLDAPGCTYGCHI